MTSLAMRSQEPSSHSSGADPGNTGREGREHARGFLGRAARYDRYGGALLPGWAAVLLALAVGALLLFVVMRARDLRPPDDLVRALAYLVPLAAVAVLFLAFGEHRDPD